MRKWLLLAFDLSIVAISPFVAVLLRQNFTISWEKFFALIPYAAYGVLAALFVFLLAGTHKTIWRYVSLRDFTRIFVSASLIVTIALLVAFFTTRLEAIARSLPLLQWGVIIAGMSGARLLARALLRQTNIPSPARRLPDNSSPENVLVVGLTQITELYLRMVRELGQERIAVAGILEESPQLSGRLVYNHQIVGTPEELPKLLKKLKNHGVEVRRVVLTVPFETLSETSRDILLELEGQGHIVLDRFEERLGLPMTHTISPPASRPHGIEKPVEMGSHSALAAVMRKHGGSAAPGTFVSPGGQNDIQLGLTFRVVKRAFDVGGALVCLLLVLPILPLISFLVALDVGRPLTFWQERPGRFGRPFRLYKYRTMRDPHDADGNWIPEEDRLSPIGRFLRRTRLDELPQLYNILVGEMSFVGPRPLLPVDQPDGGATRLLVRPGLTGWAQVNGGKLVSPQDKMVLDQWYVRHASILLDIKILFLTILTVVRGERLNPNAIIQAYTDLGMAPPNPDSAQTREGGAKYERKTERKSIRAQGKKKTGYLSRPSHRPASLSHPSSLHPHEL